MSRLLMKKGIIALDFILWQIVLAPIFCMYKFHTYNTENPNGTYSSMEFSIFDNTLYDTIIITFTIEADK